MSAKKVIVDVSSSALNSAKALAKDAHLPPSVIAACQKSGETIKEGAIAAAREASSFASVHPLAVGAVFVGVSMMAAPALIASPALGLAGFTANGVLSTSTAAVVHGNIGSVAAGSVFATLQSAGAGGYGLAAVHGAVQAAGAAVASTGGAMVAKSKL